MVAYGTHEFEEYLVKSEQIEKTEIYRPWHILEPQTNNDGSTVYHPLHDKGSIGVFLKGFLDTTATQIFQKLFYGFVLYFLV